MTEPRTDRYGRYWLTDPITGKEKAFTRVTTWAKTLSDQWALTDWKARMTAKGIATRDDLRAVAASLPVDSKNEFKEVIEEALEAAGANAARRLGDALHRWTAQADLGQEPEVPSPWDADIDAYHAALELYGVRTTGYVEQIVCAPELGIAGTFDRIVVWDPGAYIADLKTGADLSYAWGEISMQLALYANAEYLWNDERKGWDPMPPVDKTQGLVIHLPAGQAKCELWWVDLELGWSAALLAADVREWRKRKNIARPFGVDLLGRSPVQPVLDLSGSDGPAADDVDAAPDRIAPAQDGSPAAETEGTPTVLAPAGAPAGEPEVVPYPVCDCGHPWDAHRHHEILGCYECKGCRGYRHSEPATVTA